MSILLFKDVVKLPYHQYDESIAILDAARNGNPLTDFRSRLTEIKEDYNRTGTFPMGTNVHLSDKTTIKRMNRELKQNHRDAMIVANGYTLDGIRYVRGNRMKHTENHIYYNNSEILGEIVVYTVPNKHSGQYYRQYINYGSKTPGACNFLEHGASDKRDDISTAGRFGTGFKVSVAYCIRNKIDIRVYGLMLENEDEWMGESIKFSSEGSSIFAAIGHWKPNTSRYAKYDNMHRFVTELRFNRYTAYDPNEHDLPFNKCSYPRKGKHDVGMLLQYPDQLGKVYIHNFFIQEKRMIWGYNFYNIEPNSDRNDVPEWVLLKAIAKMWSILICGREVDAKLFTGKIFSDITGTTSSLELRALKFFSNDAKRVITNAFRVKFPNKHPISSYASNQDQVNMDVIKVDRNILETITVGNTTDDCFYPTLDALIKTATIGFTQSEFIETDVVQQLNQIFCNYVNVKIVSNQLGVCYISTPRDEDNVLPTIILNKNYCPTELLTDISAYLVCEVVPKVLQTYDIVVDKTELFKRVLGSISKKRPRDEIEVEVEIKRGKPDNDIILDDEEEEELPLYQDSLHAVCDLMDIAPNPPDGHQWEVAKVGFPTLDQTTRNVYACALLPK